MCDAAVMPPLQVVEAYRWLLSSLRTSPLKLEIDRSSRCYLQSDNSIPQKLCKTKANSINNKKTHNICECGENKKVKSKKCKKCYSNRNPNIKITKSRTQLRKVQRPPYEQLLLEVNEIGYVATGKKYGVSDNSIRKWLNRKMPHME